MFEEQDHEKAAGTFTLALNLKGFQEPSFWHVHQELNIPKEHGIGASKPIKDTGHFVYNKMTMNNLSTGNLSPVSSLQISKTCLKNFKEAVNMLDLGEMSDGAKDSIMMTMDELERVYQLKVSRFWEQHMEDDQDDIFDEELD